MPEVLPIVKLGHPILTEKARDVEDVTDPWVQQLIDNMIATYMDAEGLGISGPQVNEGWRVFVISSHPCPLYPDAPHLTATALINPVILGRSKKKETDWENCLSIPGIYGQVPRHVWIKLAYTNREGRQVIKIFRNFLARVCQHEMDHLDGILFLERIEPNETFTKEEFQKKIGLKPIKIRA